MTVPAEVALLFATLALGAAIATAAMQWKRACAYRARYESLRRRSLLDPLTGLFHRGVFDALLDAEVARSLRSGAPVTLLMLDLDHFKQVNDAFGHREGDAVLRAVATALRGTVRASDFACRFGGEEFAVLLPDTGAVEARLLAERMRTAVTVTCRSRTFAGALRPVTVSIGLATAPLDAASPGVLVELADRRLFAAKRAGRDRIGFVTPAPRLASLDTSTAAE